MNNYFSFTVRTSMNQRNSILVNLFDWLFHVLQTLANQWLPNYHSSNISSNILFSGSFFSRHQPFNTFWVQLQYTLAPLSKFLKQKKPILEEPLCSRGNYFEVLMVSAVERFHCVSIQINTMYFLLLFFANTHHDHELIRVKH